MTTDNPSEFLLSEPLSELSRKERRILLITSLIGIFVEKAKIIPTKVGALGIEFSTQEQQVIVVLLGSIVVYFLFAFVLYGTNDFLRWQHNFYTIMRDVFLQSKATHRKVESITKGVAWNIGEIDKLQQAVEDEMEVRAKYPFLDNLLKIAGPLSVARVAFDFLFPIVLGIYAVSIIFF